MKIAVIGYSGSGKSTLSARLSAYYGLPLLHLDTLHWLPGWQERPREEEIEILGRFLDEHSDWVIDGNYGGVLFDRRMQEADAIIFMRFGRFTCLYRAYKRYRTYRGTSRESMTDGCPEKMDREFFLWLLYKGRTKKYKERYRFVLDTYPRKVRIIKNQRQLDRYEAEMLSPT